MEEIEELCKRVFDALCSDICIVDHGQIIARGTNEELKALVKHEDGSTASLEEVFLHLTGRSLRD